MRLLALLALVTLLFGAGCGEEGGGPPAPQSPKPEQKQGQKPSQGADKAKERPLDVAAFLERGARLKTASVRGRLVPVGGRRMVLSGKDATALVVAPLSFVRGVRRPGLPVVVTGRVRRIDRELASQIDERVSRLERAIKRRRTARRETIADVRRREGDPYVVVRRVAPVRTPTRELRDLDSLERRRQR